MKYRKKPVAIEAITFEEFVQHGKDTGAHLVNGMPWSFSYMGHPITHENDQCYLINTLEGTLNFTPQDMLITGIKGEIYPCKLDIFEATYLLETTERASSLQPVQLSEKGTQVTNTLSGFLGIQASDGNHNPTRQQIFDAGVRSGLQRAGSST